MFLTILIFTFVFSFSVSTFFTPLYLLKAGKESVFAVNPLGRFTSITAMLLDPLLPPALWIKFAHAET